MFGANTETKILRSDEVTSTHVGDINRILRQHHSKAGRVDQKTLSSHAKNSRVVVALNNSDRIVGVGMLVKISVLSHTYASIHNLGVVKGGEKEVGMSMLKALMEGIEDVAFIEAGVLPEDSYAIAVLTALGFAKKPKLRFRFNIKPKK